MDDAPLPRFLEKVAGVLGHDLRSPLGAIANYASLLEGDSAPTVDELGDVAGRVRNQAAQVAEMASLVAEALLIVSRRPTSVRGDPAELLRTIARAVDREVDVSSVSGADERAAVDVELDPEVAGFVWRAFLKLDAGVRARPPRNLVVRARRERRVARVEVGIDGALDALRPAVALDPFVRGAAGKVAASHRLALELGRELVDCRGGSLELFGSPGRDAGIGLTLPQAG